LLLIVGPCSIHDLQSAKEYALKLRTLMDAVSNTFFVVMRTYFEKPRTSLGWKGLLSDPCLDGSNRIAEGVRMAREFLMFLADHEIPAATEFLDPSTPHFIGDLISWSCIGARTSESQIHRQFASGLPMPVAFKNSTSGNIQVAINGIIAASTPHAFPGITESGYFTLVSTEGNPYAHVALRGGEFQPNYDSASLAYAAEKLCRSGLPQRFLVDCSHDNSCRNYAQQIQVFQSVLAQYIEGNKTIRGMALESHLYAGNQSIEDGITSLQYGISITDPCLDWKSTKELILNGSKLLERSPLCNATVAEHSLTQACARL
jgi:3-deoxy-7-phosphoheptulonate synthase